MVNPAIKSRIDWVGENCRLLAQIQSCEPESAAGKRVAIVATSDALFGMARMYELGTEGRMPGVATFRSLEEARIHLGLDGA